MSTSVAPPSAPPVVASPSRVAAIPPIGAGSFLRVPDFLTAPAAEAVHRELSDGLLYERVEIGDVTRQWRGERELGNAYEGPILTRDGWETTPLVRAVYALFADPWFEAELSRLVGQPVVRSRPVTPYRMELGDRICTHDDLSDERHAASVVLNLTRRWRRVDGGNTVVGRVTRAVDLPDDPRVPFTLQHLYLARQRSVLTPRFNSLTVLRLRPGLAHAVTPVRGSGVRYSLTCMYRYAGDPPHE